MGGWQIDQNRSHIETRNDLARSVVVGVRMCSIENEAAKNKGIFSGTSNAMR